MYVNFTFILNNKGVYSQLMYLMTIIKKIFRIILKVIFKFDWWHTSPLDNRPYALDIIAELNKKSDKGAVLELGCGLGDIIGKVKYQNKYFFDISINVLKAAQFVQLVSLKKSIDTFLVFDFLKDSIDLDIELDAIVLVNWIHACDGKILKKKISNLVNSNLKKDGILIFDLIEENNTYKHNHVLSDLIEIELYTVCVSDKYRFGRRIVYASLK